jgi:protein-S-isoprenylcysteine O-methyltransferase Ste14
MQTLELRIPPPLAALLLGLAMWAAARPLPAADRMRFPVATACALLGASVAFLGFWACRRARTTVSAKNLEAASTVVTGGIFRCTRNPMYVGLAGILLGWAVWL